MTLYAPTDVRSIAVPEGCGHAHQAGDLAEGDRMVLDCPPCEIAIQQKPSMGWSTHPHGATLTPDERAETDRITAQAQKAGMANLAALAGGLSTAGTPAGVPAEVLAQLADMKAANAALLAKVEQLSQTVAAGAAPGGDPGSGGVVVQPSGTTQTSTVAEVSVADLASGKPTAGKGKTGKGKQE